MPTYQHIFFDLDHTLWDYDTNSARVLAALYQEYTLHQVFPGSLETFIEQYHVANRAAWDLFNHNKLSKESLRLRRFAQLIPEEYPERDPLIETLSTAFFERCPLGSATLPGTVDLLEALAPHYQLHIITNGFADTQAQKMEAAGIASYFRTVTTSECSGWKKPDPRIFHLALEKAGAQPETSLMVGDNPETDIGGAQNVGLDTAFYGEDFPQQQAAPTYHIRHLHELITHLVPVSVA